MQRLTGKRWIRAALAAFLLPWCLSLCAAPTLGQASDPEPVAAETHQGCHSQAAETAPASDHGDCPHCEEADDWASGFVFAPLALFSSPDLAPWPRRAPALVFNPRLRAPPSQAPPLYLVHEVFLI